jgi:putative transposase
MSYTINPYSPKARRLAVNLVRVQHKKPAQVARLYGIHRSTMSRWLKRAHPDHRVFLHNISSRPHFHPNQLPQSLVNRVIAARTQSNRCAQVVWAQLTQEHIQISLSSVKRIIARYHLTRRKKRHIRTQTRFRRPESHHPGDLVEVDTIHFVTGQYERFYVYAVIDTYSRMGYAEYQPRLTTGITVQVIRRALQYFQFPVSVIQTDNGHEFGEYVFWELQKEHIRLRHTRVRKPNDNAHVERYIRTIQEECFNRMLPKVESIRRKLTKYNEYYNTERIHLGIGCKTPKEMLLRS